ncbi:hypothetical protein J7E73_15380 [Paenibacillus albidus]|uniref:hypothetical protein n=1 Tax=Paenibacillus albidus TaxID=2041023 RepID=UPI001BE65DEA|nr:hypothetical protein [Paenibacillus albidus]MBT2290488.1 hypothetical protein [Paenibacillus albidus]
MSNLDIRREPPATGKPIYKHKYERTAFDYTAIVFAYLFAPLGFVLAILRMATTHSRNQRKASNFSLLYHVCMGAFIELGIYFIIIKLTRDINYVGLLIRLVIIYFLFRIPAIKFSVRAVGQKEGFTTLCNDYIALVLVDGIRHIGSLSDIRGQSEENVRRDLNYLIGQGLLSPDIVYYEGRIANPFVKVPPKLVHPGRTDPSVAPRSGQTSELAQSGQPSAARPEAQRRSSGQQAKSVSCPGCGARNLAAPGQSRNCDYCGTVLSNS